MNNKKGFTLAEVLVTLAVIGVVAALTIPALIQSSNEKQAKTSIKKALSVLNQALTMSIAQNGIDAASNSTFSTHGDNGLRELFAQHISVIDNTDNSITSADGMKYTFTATDVCQSSSSATPNCVVEVDINGDKGAEEAGSTGNYQDLYYFVVLKEQVIPANTVHSWTAFGRDDSSSTTAPPDNVVLDALIN